MFMLKVTKYDDRAFISVIYFYNFDYFKIFYILFYFFLAFSRPCYDGRALQTVIFYIISIFPEFYF